ncbi:hypothetical protein U0070_027393, partial [Myodes glareolus]
IIIPRGAYCCVWVLIADPSLASTVGNGPEERGKLGMREEMDIIEKQKEHPGPFGMYVLLQNKRRGSDRWKVERRDKMETPSVGTILAVNTARYEHTCSDYLSLKSPPELCDVTGNDSVANNELGQVRIPEMVHKAILWGLNVPFGTVEPHRKSIAPAGSKSLQSKNASDIAKCNVIIEATLQRQTFHLQQNQIDPTARHQIFKPQLHSQNLSHSVSKCDAFSRLFLNVKLHVL